MRAASPAALRYARLFNAGDWDGLRALLADDVRLDLASKPPRAGAADVRVYFTVYAGMTDVRVVPAWLEDREVLAVYADGETEEPAYVVLIEWRDDRISLIRDFHYTRYLIEGAEVRPAASPRAVRD